MLVKTGSPIYFQNLDDYPLDNEQMQRQIQLDSEALQRLFMSQMAQQAATPPPANQNQGQNVKMSSGALSPLGQAMLQIHSPSLSASGTDGTEADVGENGANDLVREENNVSHVTVTSASKGSDEVFAEKNSDRPGVAVVNSDITQTTLQSAFPPLTATHIGPVYTDKGNAKNVSDVMNINAINAKLMAEINGSGSMDVTKMKDSIINGGQKTSKGNSPTGLKSPAFAASEIIIPRPPIQSNAAMSAGSPRSSSGSHERRRIKKEPRDPPKPHPAFNVPPGTIDKLNGIYYNYSLPDRGLGSSMSPVTVPVSVSPPAVRHQRSPPGTHRSPPVTHQRLPSTNPVLASQAGPLMGMMGPGWPVRGTSPSGDSRSSGSPLDLSGPKETLVKMKPDFIPRDVPIKPKQAKPNQTPVQSMYSPSQIPRMALSVPNTHIPVHSTPIQMPKVQTQVMTTPVQVPSFQRSEISGQIKQEPQRKNEEEKKQASTPPQKQASPSPQSKIPYVKETLYLFGDKDLEIISVGRNKWIIRNEMELCKLVKEHTGGTEDETANENTRKTENCSNCQKQMEGKDNNVETTRESLTAEAAKRQNDTEDNSPQRTKVTKLTNGDIHSEENSPQAEHIMVPQTEYSNVSGVSSGSVNVLPPSTIEIAHSVAAIMNDTQSSSPETNTCPVLATMLNVKPL